MLKTLRIGTPTYPKLYVPEASEHEVSILRREQVLDVVVYPIFG